MNEKKHLVPSCRFPEYEGSMEWKVALVKDVCFIGTGKSNSQDQDESGKYPFFIRSENPVKSKRYLYDCEAVITIGDGKIGKVFHYVNGKFDLHQRCYRMTDFNGVNGKFFYYFFSSHFYDRAMRMTAKATVDSVRLEMISEMPIYFPSISEQEKIANCLSSIDSCIASINEKIEELKAHKKGLMQKLFPQNGQTIPEYRFPEFEKDGAWVEIKVSDIFEITRGHVLAASNTKSAPDDEYRYPVFSSQTAKNGLMGYYNKPLYTDAITWTTDGANAGTVNYREGPFYCTNVCGVLLSNKGYANKCIAELLSMEAKKHVSYVGNPKLMNNVMAEIKLYIPSIREQHRIASCLSSIDMLRQVNTEKRVQLEKIKKGLVQHLFPQI